MSKCISVRCVAVTATLLGAVVGGCGSAGSGSSGSSLSEGVSAGCTLAITQNTYDGPEYWGTLTVKNDGPSEAKGYEVSFDVPDGAHCTNDTVPSGAKLSPLEGTGSSATTRLNQCVFTWSSATLAAGASTTFNYSTDSTSFTRATNVVASATSCAATRPVEDAGVDASKADASKPDAGPPPACIPAAGVSNTAGPLVIDSLDCDVTENEVNAYLTVVSGTPIPTSQHPGTDHNYLADGIGGTILESINRLYEVTGDMPGLEGQHTKLLDLAIRWNDAWLSHRNDKPLGEHRVMWTGKVDAVWPPNPAPDTYAGCEVGETVGILAYTALNIVKTPALANVTVPDGDPQGYGATYLERAKTYVAMLEQSMDGFFNAHFLHTTTLTIQKPAAAAWTALAPEENVNAWNREMMFLHAWETLALVHAVLGDDPAKQAEYETITRNTVNLFVKNAQSRTAPDGTPILRLGLRQFRRRDRRPHRRANQRPRRVRHLGPHPRLRRRLHGRDRGRDGEVRRDRGPRDRHLPRRVRAVRRSVLHHRNTQLPSRWPHDARPLRPRHLPACCHGGHPVGQPEGQPVGHGEHPLGEARPRAIGTRRDSASTYAK